MSANTITPVTRTDKLSQIIGRINPMLTAMIEQGNTVSEISDTVDQLAPENIPDFTLIFDNHLI